MAGARPDRIARIAARTRVHSGYEHKSRRVGEGDSSPGYCHLPVFERLTQKIEHVSPKLREFIQKKDPVVGEADLTWLRDVAAADQTSSIPQIKVPKTITPRMNQGPYFTALFHLSRNKRTSPVAI